MFFQCIMYERLCEDIGEKLVVPMRLAVHALWVVCDAQQVGLGALNTTRVLARAACDRLPYGSSERTCTYGAIGHSVELYATHPKHNTHTEIVYYVLQFFDVDKNVYTCLT